MDYIPFYSLLRTSKFNSCQGYSCPAAAFARPSSTGQFAQPLAGVGVGACWLAIPLRVQGPLTATQRLIFALRLGKGDIVQDTSTRVSPLFLGCVIEGLLIARDLHGAVCRPCRSCWSFSGSSRRGRWEPLTLTQHAYVGIRNILGP